MREKIAGCAVPIGERLTRVTVRVAQRPALGGSGATGRRARNA
jgi:hypothetical protein